MSCSDPNFNLAACLAHSGEPLSKPLFVKVGLFIPGPRLDFNSLVLLIVWAAQIWVNM